MLLGSVGNSMAMSDSGISRDGNCAGAGITDSGVKEISQQAGCGVEYDCTLERLGLWLQFRAYKGSSPTVWSPFFNVKPTMKWNSTTSGIDRSGEARHVFL